MASPTGSAPPPPGRGPDPVRAAGPLGAGSSHGVGAQAGKGTPVTLPDGWVGTVTDKIVTTVDGVRAKTTVPIEKVGRIVVWGLLIATAGIGLGVALLVGALRLAYEAVGNIPGISDRPGRSVWIIDVLLGVVLILVGLLFVKKGTKPAGED
jgi:hypothetical protein